LRGEGKHNFMTFLKFLVHLISYQDSFHSVIALKVTSLSG